MDKLITGAFSESEIKILMQDEFFCDKLAHCETLTHFELLCDYALVLLGDCQKSSGTAGWQYHGGIQGK